MAQLTAGQDTRAGAGRGESGLGKLLEGGVEWSGVGSLGRAGAQTRSLLLNTLALLNHRERSNLADSDH